MVETAGTHRITCAEFEKLGAAALQRAGANVQTIAALMRATLDAEARRNPVVGGAHLLDYLDALRDGRINGNAEPLVRAARAGVLTVNADRGVAQLAFDDALDALTERAHDTGVAVLSVNNSYSGGALGYYAARAAEAGLVAFACGNSSALMAVHGARRAITGTNPFAFALPHAEGPRLFDQASSATAWVKIREAAIAGEPIAEGSAIDAQGDPTTDAAAAMTGAVLPFGGVKGGNIALMVEMLATLAGGAFSLDAAPFDSGSESPGLGLFVLVLDPSAFDPDYPERAETHLARLARDHGVDFGRRKTPPTHIELTEEDYRALSGSPTTNASKGTE
ncbi:MAG: Ldh family oxidoreductase [Leucobacter sp.]